VTSDGSPFFLFSFLKVNPISLEPSVPNVPGKDNIRIKPLFLYQGIYLRVEELQLTYKQILTLINHMISVFVDREEFEVAASFKRRKFKKYKKWRKLQRLWSFKLFIRVWRFRLYKIFKIRRD
jgi:hypothetical protein